MFRNTSEGTNNKQMHAIQIVDSSHILQILRLQIRMATLVKGYRLLKDTGNCTLQGIYFEMVIHKWFEERKPDFIKDFCWSQGNTVEGVGQLISPNVYWVPSVCNFPQH